MQDIIRIVVILLYIYNEKWPTQCRGCVGLGVFSVGEDVCTLKYPTSFELLREACRVRCDNTNTRSGLCQLFPACEWLGRSGGTVYIGISSRVVFALIACKNPDIRIADIGDRVRRHSRYVSARVC